jgi:hypothetical protein
MDLHATPHVPQIEVIRWWNALEGSDRTQKSKELHIWSRFEDWTREWKYLGIAQRKRLVTAMDAVKNV